MSHMDTTWRVTGLGALLLFVESARTQLCFLPSQNSMTFGSIKLPSWVATQTLPVLCCHFLAVNNPSPLPQDALSHHVPLAAAEPALKKADVQLESFFWEHRQEQSQCGVSGRAPTVRPN